VSVEMNHRKGKELPKPKGELRLPGSAGADDEDSIGAAQSFDVVYGSH
jgi:hypothetical protein